MAITHVLVIPFPGQGHVNPIMLFFENWWSMVSDSTDEHTDVPDEVTMTNVRWWVKGSNTLGGYQARLSNRWSPLKPYY